MLTIVSFFILILCLQVSEIFGKGIGFAFSGAGGRIAQHGALMEALNKGLYPAGKPIRPDYISGASSGAISAVALNALIQTAEQKLPNGFTWDDYKKLVFDLTTGDVFDNSWEGITKIMTHNIFAGYFLDNTPLRKYLEPWIKKMNYSQFGDLYIPTAISLVNQSSGNSHRFWSTDPRYRNINLLDMIMGSASLPIAFSPMKIDGLGDTIWIDGGTGIDTIPVEALIQNPDVTEMYLICYGSAFTSGGSGLPDYLADIYLLANALATINDMRVDLFYGALDNAVNSHVTTYTFIPDLNQTFSALDFDHEKLEYDLAMDWALKNNPTRVN